MMLDEALKDLKKNAQKLIINTAIGNSMNQKVSSNKQKVEETSAEELSSVKSTMVAISDNLGNSVKGQFGKQVKETIKTQSEKLDVF